MKTVSVEGYLDQAKLEAALRQIVGESAWRGREVRAEPRRLSGTWSLSGVGRSSRSNSTAMSTTGTALKIKADREKDEVARASGTRVVRFPYWVQLTSETLEHYFGLEANVVQAFPHGFVTTKHFPSSFCEMGLERFARELEAVPKHVRGAVVESLRARMVEHGIEYVVPRGLRHLVE